MKKVIPLFGSTRKLINFHYSDKLVDRSTGLPIRQLDLFNDILNSNRETFFKNYVNDKKKKAN